MSKDLCFVCDRGSDESSFCEECTSHLNEGRMEEALYDLNLAILKELRIANGVKLKNTPVGPETRVFLIEVNRRGKDPIKLIKAIKHEFTTSLHKAKKVVDGLDHIEFFGSEARAEEIIHDLSHHSEGCYIRIKSVT